MKRRRVTATNRVRSVGDRVPEREGQKLRADRADCCQTAVAFNRQNISNGCFHTRVWRDRSRKRDLDLLEIAARFSARPEICGRAADCYCLDLGFRIQTQCESSPRSITNVCCLERDGCAE